MWLPQGGALKIVNLQFTQYSIIILLSSMLYLTVYAYSLFICWSPKMHSSCHISCAIPTMHMIIINEYTVFIAGNTILSLLNSNHNCFKIGRADPTRTGD